MQQTKQDDQSLNFQGDEFDWKEKKVFSKLRGWFTFLVSKTACRIIN